MIIWILNSDSGIKLLYKSFLKTDADEDIVSGFLTAFHHFSMEEFHQSLESIEMGGLKWIYTLEPNFKLLFVAADVKTVKTEILMGRLNVIKEAFLKEFEPVWIKKKHSWDGNMNVYLPFLKVIEDYYGQWEEVESISQVADFFDVLGVFQQILNLLINNTRNGEVYMTSKKYFTSEEAKTIGEKLGINWSKFDIEQYRMGLDVELEHGFVDPHTNVTNDDPIMTGKIALAHLNEFPDYYTRLDKMEKEAEGKL